jgi:hypothetical protein
MARTGKRKARKTPSIVDQYLRPTEQREAHNDFRNDGMARRTVPMIETLKDAGKITADQYARFAYYRDQASIADRSPVKSGIDFSIGGNGHGPGVAIMSAELETGRMERDMGQLWRIARAIAVNDYSLTRWCVQEYGGRERYDKDGRFIAMVPVREKASLALALLELRHAANRITLRG